VLEREWLTCPNPYRMMSALQGRVSDRKWRLLACACYRRIWHLLTDAGSRRAVEAAEEYADRPPGDAYLRDAGLGGVYAPDEPLSTVVRYVQFAGPNTALDHALDSLYRAAEMVDTAAPRPRKADIATERRAQAELVREIFPYPFRPITTDSGWCAWQGGRVTQVADAIYDSRAYGDLPVLADALEEAGCTSIPLLDHLRSGGDHYRGCWALDVVVGKG